MSNFRTRLFIATTLRCKNAGLLILLQAVLFAPSPADAQQAAKVWRIGWLGLDSSMQATRILAFENGLRDLGYVEGKNISIERRWAEGRFDRLPGSRLN